MMNMVRAILELQKRELEDRRNEEYIERETKLDIKNPLIKVIIGPRRAGKSFFAIRSLIPTGSFGYANFDDEKLVLAKDYDEIIATLNSLYGNPKIFLFDEIQNLSNWELFVNRLHRQGYNLVLTGSNAQLLSKELATHLTGRHVPIYLFPFSFKEYLTAIWKKQPVTAEIKTSLEEYLFNGDYPEPTIKKLNSKEYLSLLFDATIYKDIVKRYKLRSASAVNDLTLFLLSNIATEHTFHSLCRAVGIKSPNTVRKYMRYLDEAFLIFTIPRFSFKVKERFVAARKIYTYDNGFVSAKASTSAPNSGRIYENCVAMQLTRNAFTNGTEIFYWKNTQKEEVDFVIKKGSRITELIQVCFDIENEKTREREIRALLKAKKELRCDQLLIITSEKEGKESAEWFGMKGEVTYIPLWKWLLEQSSNR